MKFGRNSQLYFCAIRIAHYNYVFINRLNSNNYNSVQLSPVQVLLLRTNFALVLSNFITRSLNCFNKHVTCSKLSFFSTRYRRKEVKAKSIDLSFCLADTGTQPEWDIFTATVTLLFTATVTLLLFVLRLC